MLFSHIGRNLVADSSAKIRIYFDTDTKKDKIRHNLIKTSRIKNKNITKKATGALKPR